MPRSSSFARSKVSAAIAESPRPHAAEDEMLDVQSSRWRRKFLGSWRRSRIKTRVRCAVIAMRWAGGVDVVSFFANNFAR
jgi:hypothetical protein